MTGKNKSPSALPDHVIAINDLHASAYLIRNEDSYIAVDSGQTAGSMRAALRKLGIEPEQISTVLLTHTDADHTGGISLFSNADVYIAKAEEPLIDGTTLRTLSKYGVSFGGNRLSLPFKTLEDGEILAAGARKVECILTPGHTPGSMCFLVDDTLLFTGDTLGIEKGRFTGFIPLYTMDVEENKRSISKLVNAVKTKHVEYVFTGHHGCSNRYPELSEGW